MEKKDTTKKTPSQKKPEETSKEKFVRLTNSVNAVSSELEALKSKIQKEKNAETTRTNSIDTISSELEALKLNIQKENIPMNSNEFRLFIKQKVFKGFSKKQIESGKFKIKINEKLAELANQTLFQIEEHRRIKKVISGYSINNKIQKFPSHLLPQLKEFLSEIGIKLTKSFLEISPLTYIENIIVSYEEENALALRIEIRLKNKSVCSPKQILSEANLDLLALMFFISFIDRKSVV